MKQHNFPYRVVNSCNELPDVVLLAGTLTQRENKPEIFWNHEDFKFERTFLSVVFQYHFFHYSFGVSIKLFPKDSYNFIMSLQSVLILYEI